MFRRGRAVVQTVQANLQMYLHRVMGALSLNQHQDVDHAKGSPFLQGTHYQDVRVVCSTQPAKRLRQVWEVLA